MTRTIASLTVVPAASRRLAANATRARTTAITPQNDAIRPADQWSGSVHRNLRHFSRSNRFFALGRSLSKAGRRNYRTFAPAPTLTDDPFDRPSPYAKGSLTVAL